MLREVLIQAVDEAKQRNGEVVRGVSLFSGEPCRYAKQWAECKKRLKTFRKRRKQGSSYIDLSNRLQPRPSRQEIEDVKSYAAVSLMKLQLEVPCGICDCCQKRIKNNKPLDVISCDAASVYH